ncbi:CHAT domain-containing protein [Gracilimonas sediminicola]|uniref:CHAT domain-containing protein n=1 Tax=Gracilimonas sediminicola TaxID=2952158 RepID=UPI0038D4CFEF
MILLYLILFLAPFSSDTAYVKKTETQIAAYVSNIEKGQNVSLNSWAIHEIASLNCEGLDIVKSSVQSLTEKASFYDKISCDELDELSQSFWDKTESDLFKQIINSEDTVSTEIIGYDEHPLIHFRILMEEDLHNYYSTNYLKNALENWLSYINSEPSNNGLEYAIVLSNVIRTAYILDRYGVIQENFEKFVNQNWLPNSIHRLKLLGAFDYTFYIYGEYDKSLQLQRNYSLPLAMFIGNKTEINSIKVRQGAYLISLGKYQAAKVIYEELYNESETLEEQYSLFTNLGATYLKLGQSNKYISFQLRALDQEIEEYTTRLKIYRNLFIYYSSINDINTALNYIEQARKLATDKKDTSELALINSYLGTFYWTNYKDADKALANLNSASQILSPEKNYETYIDLLIEKGIILSKIDSLTEARLTFQNVKQLTLSRSDTPDYLDAVVNLTAIDLKQNKIKDAAKNLEDIQLYSLENMDFQLSVKYQTVKSNYFSLSGNDRAAIDNLLPVIDQVIDRAKNNTDTQEGYWSVEDEYLDAFELIVELLINNNRSPEALEILDRLKTINDATLYNSPLVKAAKLTEEELAEEKRLNQRIQSLRKKYLNATQEERFQINTQIDRISAVRNQILADVNLDKEEPLPPIWSIQRSLNEDELLLHFTEVGTKLYVSYLTSSQIKIKYYTFDKQRQALFSQIGDNLASGNTNLFELYRLHEILDLKDIPSQIKQISVVPDNYLYRIPLEVLPTEKPDSPISFGSTRYLIEEYHFRYFTSLKEFDSNRRTFSASTETDFSGFAISDFQNFKGTNLPSLPYATVETNNITNVLSSFNNKKVFTGDAATKDIFKQKVGTSRLVHVATHSEVSEKDPLFSTIYLKNSSDSDTLQSDQALYAYELFDTPLNSEFIMLNSCSSGSGSYIQGSGIMGISRALRYAGAKSLALNLWSVNDKVASEFATDFYDLLNEGETKSEAIRQAKLNQLKRANANPHFWGAYMMIGNPSPVTNKSTNAGLIFSLLALTGLLTGFITYRKESSG